MTSRRLIDGEEGGEVDLKSQRPRRRKQAWQVARPGIGDGSACQPNSARVRASRLMEGVEEDSVCKVAVDGDVEAVEDGFRSRSRWLDAQVSVKAGGVEREDGRSEAMAVRDS